MLSNSVILILICTIKVFEFIFSFYQSTNFIFLIIFIKFTFLIIHQKLEFFFFLSLNQLLEKWF